MRDKCDVLQNTQVSSTFERETNVSAHHNINR